LYYASDSWGAFRGLSVCQNPPELNGLHFDQVKHPRSNFPEDPMSAAGPDEGRTTVLSEKWVDVIRSRIRV
jgi:hypothetical protein